MTSLLPPVMACHHWISVCAEASPAATASAAAARQPKPIEFLIVLSPAGACVI